MNWEKLKPNHFFKEPIEHFYASTLFDMPEYDMLYENQNDLSHKVWQDFDKKYKTGFQFYDDIREIDKNKEVICLWFFKERTDRVGAEDIVLEGKKITYFQNSFLITKSKDIRILERQKPKHRHNRRPFLQLDLKNDTWEELLKRFNKRT